MAQNTELGHQPTPIFTGDCSHDICTVGNCALQVLLMASCDYCLY